MRESHIAFILVHNVFKLTIKQRQDANKYKVITVVIDT